MSGSIKKIMRMILYSDLQATRFTLGLAELVWAVSLFWPGDTFDRPTYDAMKHCMVSEELWGCVWVFSGLTQWYILFSGKYHTPSAVFFACFNAILWWFATIGMYLSVYPPPAAIGGELALSVSAAWIWIRSGWIPRRGCYADTE